MLALTDQRWLIFEEEEDESVSVSEVPFDDTLLVELTEILLFGQLEIGFASGGEAQSSAVQFNTSMDKPYREAVQLALNGIQRLLPLPHDADSGQAALSLSEWPLKVRNSVSWNWKRMQAMEVRNYKSCFPPRMSQRSRN